MVHWNAPREGNFLCGVVTFVPRDVHSEHVYLPEESLPGVLRLKKTEFVLIIFYLQLINSGHAEKKTTVSFPLEDKHVANEHNAVRKVMTRQTRKMSSRGK